MNHFALPSRVLWTLPLASLCTVSRMGPNPQTNKTKEMGATDCLDAPRPEAAITAVPLQRELVVLTALVQGHVPILDPTKVGLAGATMVCGMLSVTKDGWQTIFKFSFGPVNHLILGEVILCCIRHAHTFTHAHRSTH